MATKPAGKPANKNLPATRKTNQVYAGDWEAEVAAAAAGMMKTEASQREGKLSVRFRHGAMTVGDNPVRDNKMEVILLDGILKNVWYRDKFDPDNPVAPSCFALGRGDDEDMLAPHETCTDENKFEPQSETCQDCHQNVFGSSDTGKGKACKNSRGIAFLACSPMSQENLENGEILYADIPVTSVKNYSRYVKHLMEATGGKHPMHFVTVISSRPDDKNQVSVEFEAVMEGRDRAPLQVPAKLMPIVVARFKECQAPLVQPFTYIEPTAIPRRAAAAKAKGHKVDAQKPAARKPAPTPARGKPAAAAAAPRRKF